MINTAIVDSVVRKANRLLFESFCATGRDMERLTASSCGERVSWNQTRAVLDASGHGDLLTMCDKAKSEGGNKMSVKLTKRELEILHLKASGYAHLEIAKILGISTNTIRVHINKVLLKLQAANTIAAIVMVIRDGGIDPATLDIQRR